MVNIMINMINMRYNGILGGESYVLGVVAIVLLKGTCEWLISQLIWGKGIILWLMDYGKWIKKIKM